MADHTPIEWTDATWNPVTGCSVHSPGCTNCYAMQLAGTRLAHHPSRAGLTRETKAGPVWTGEVRFNEQWLTQPLKWKRPRRIFVCAHGDLFHENVPDEWIDRVFAVMALAPQHTFQVLTKRSDRMRDYISHLTDANAQWERIGDAAAMIVGNPGYVTAGEREWPLPNVWLGVSVEDQARADERVPDLLDTPAAQRWISAEPLLGPVDLNAIEGPGSTQVINALVGFSRDPDWVDYNCSIDWVVAGGESGPDARPMDTDWARALRDQCAAAGVPFLFKQHGEWIGVDTMTSQQRADVGDLERLRADPRTASVRLGKKAAGRLLDGVLHDAYPQVAA